MERLGVQEFTISEFGLREGLFFDHFWRDIPSHLTPDPREFSVLSLGRFYGFQEAHARHVRHLALRLFERLQPLHGYGEWEAELLGAAGLLHDIGLAIKYNDHHKYSQTLIAGNALPGYSSREVALISLLARFHRKGTPTAGEFTPLMQEGDDLRLMRLSALVRLAEFLERGRAGIVRDVLAEWDKKQLRLTLVADEFPAVELWSAQRGAVDLLESAFGRSVQMDSAVVNSG
jgi:exopolyphosphatase/guanosine-5'-triphosphate,3'-diphosphate pyrophosphatase